MIIDIQVHDTPQTTFEELHNFEFFVLDLNLYQKLPLGAAIRVDTKHSASFQPHQIVRRIEKLKIEAFI